MVNIQEESSEPLNPDSASTSAGGSGSGSGSGSTAGGRGIPAMIALMKEKQTDAVLWILRLVTIACTFLYIFPLNVNQNSMYQKALIAGAATNALRLHQRLGGFRFSREFFGQIFLEDSCHYLFFCLVLMSMTPITMGIFPVFLFAFLHWSNFTIQLLNIGGWQNGILYRLVAKLVNEYSQSMLLLIASTEIFLFPLILVSIFMGRASIFMPFVYYRFLSLRYMSRRNPNTRFAFSQMRNSLEAAVSQPGCPAVIRTAAHRLISLICRFAPQVQPAAE